jgi:hypothetical protein
VPHEKPEKHWPIECLAGSLHPDELSDFFSELCSQISKRIDYNDLTLENLECFKSKYCLILRCGYSCASSSTVSEFLDDTEAQRGKMQMKIQ